MAPPLATLTSADPICNIGVSKKQRVQSSEPANGQLQLVRQTSSLALDAAFTIGTLGKRKSQHLWNDSNGSNGLSCLTNFLPASSGPHLATKHNIKQKDSNEKDKDTFAGFLDMFFRIPLSPPHLWAFRWTLVSRDEVKVKRRLFFVSLKHISQCE